MKSIQMVHWKKSWIVIHVGDTRINKNQDWMLRTSSLQFRQGAPIFNGGEEGNDELTRTYALPSDLQLIGWVISLPTPIICLPKGKVSRSDWRVFSALAMSPRTPPPQRTCKSWKKMKVKKALQPLVLPKY